MRIIKYYPHGAPFYFGVLQFLVAGDGVIGWGWTTWDGEGVGSGSCGWFECGNTKISTNRIISYLDKFQIIQTKLGNLSNI